MRVDPRHAPGRAHQRHPQHPRPDVLPPRWMASRSLQQMVIILASNRADMIRPRHPTAGPDRPENQGLASHEKRRRGDLPHLYRCQSAARSSAPARVRRRPPEGDQRHHRKGDRWPSSASATTTASSRSPSAAGRHEYLHRGDLVSGAIIAGIVERAKETAIKRAIESPEPTGLSIKDFVDALNVEYKTERHLPAQRHHRGLAQAGRLRSRKRPSNFRPSNPAVSMLRRSSRKIYDLA